MDQEKNGPSTEEFFLIYFSCLIDLARVFGTVLNKNTENTHSSDLKVFQLFAIAQTY